MDQILNTRQACEFLKIGRRTLRAWIADGLPCQRGPRYRFLKSELLDWWKERRKRALVSGLGVRPELMRLAERIVKGRAA